MTRDIFDQAREIAALAPSPNCADPGCPDCVRLAIGTQLTALIVAMTRSRFGAVEGVVPDNDAEAVEVFRVALADAVGAALLQCAMSLRRDRPDRAASVTDSLAWFASRAMSYASLTLAASLAGQGPMVRDLRP
jgi:hypothetical protein